MSKIIAIPSEIRNILSEKRIDASMETFLRVMEGLHIGNRDLGGEMSAKAMLNSLKDTKARKYSKKYRCHYIAVDAVLGSRKVRLFFCRRGKNEGWKVLLTTDTSLNSLRAYEIYAMRWSIEVIFSVYCVHYLDMIQDTSTSQIQTSEVSTCLARMFKYLVL